MKSIIKEIYDGNRGCHENVKVSKKYWKLLETENAIYDKICELLSAEQVKLLNDYVEACGETSAELAQNNFIEGFKIGLLIGIEIKE